MGGNCCKGALCKICGIISMQILLLIWSLGGVVFSAATLVDCRFFSIDGSSIPSNGANGFDNPIRHVGLIYMEDPDTGKCIEFPGWVNESLDTMFQISQLMGVVALTTGCLCSILLIVTFFIEMCCAVRGLQYGLGVMFLIGTACQGLTFLACTTSNYSRLSGSIAQSATWAIIACCLYFIATIHAFVVPFPKEKICNKECFCCCKKKDKTEEAAKSAKAAGDEEAPPVPEEVDDNNAAAAVAAGAAAGAGTAAVVAAADDDEEKGLGGPDAPPGDDPKAVAAGAAAGAGTGAAVAAAADGKDDLDDDDEKDPFLDSDDEDPFKEEDAAEDAAAAAAAAGAGAGAAAGASVGADDSTEVASGAGEVASGAGAGAGASAAAGAGEGEGEEVEVDVFASAKSLVSGSMTGSSGGAKEGGAKE